MTGVAASDATSKAPTKGADAPAASASSSPSSTSRRSRPNKTSGAVSYKVPEKNETSVMTDEEEALKQIEQIQAMAKLFPSADPWGQRVETLDVSLPYSVGLVARKSYPTWRAIWDQFVANRFNGAKNATSMLKLAQADAIPGVDLSGAKLYQKLFTQWPWKIFTTTSTRSGSWMDPLRKAALSSYQQLNTAVAQKDERTIKELTTSSYQDTALRLKRSQNPNFKYIWRFHREVNPARVLSIRATEGYLAAEEPKFGNRMMVHALVKIDTEQSLEIYDKRGQPIHAIDAASRTSGTAPAEKRRVTEYLIFEKRMWYDGPWVIREQLWEAPGKIAAA